MAAGKKPENRKRGYKYIQVGVEWGFSVFIGIFAGYQADEYFGVGPWLTLLGLFFGMAAGVYFFYRTMKNG